MVSAKNTFLIIFFKTLILLFSQPIHGQEIVKGKNLSKKFYQYYKSYQAPEALGFAEFQQLKNDYQIIFVSGFFTNVYHQLGLFISFEDQQKWLSKEQIPFKTAPIQSQAKCKINRPILYEIINHSQKPVILIVHSMGGLVAVTTILNHLEQFLKEQKVAGVIAIQTPFKGSPIANFVHKNMVFKGLAHLALKPLGGCSKTIKSFTTERRNYHLRKWEEEIKILNNNIPLLSVASSIKKNPFPLLGYFMKQKQTSDGIVLTQDSLFPGQDFIVLKNINHLDTIGSSKHIPTRNKKFHRVAFFKSILKILMEKISIQNQKMNKVGCQNQEEVPNLSLLF